MSYLITSLQARFSFDQAHISQHTNDTAMILSFHTDSFGQCCFVVVVLGFYIPPTAKVIRRQGSMLHVSLLVMNTLNQT